MRDPYQVLGVPSTATDEEVKKAYTTWRGSITRTIITTTRWLIWRRSA